MDNSDLKAIKECDDALDALHKRAEVLEQAKKKPLPSSRDVDELAIEVRKAQENLKLAILRTITYMLEGITPPSR